MKVLRKIVVIIAWCLLCLVPSQMVFAEEDAAPDRAIETNGYVPWTLSPDGRAWTVDEPLGVGEDVMYEFNSRGSVSLSSKIIPPYWYPRSTTVSTGEVGNPVVAGVGQHLYTYQRDGMIPISEWDVVHSHGRCIHDGASSDFHGILSSSDAVCFGKYWSGWNPRCADCGEYVSRILFYMKKETVQKITAINLSYDYFFQCPCILNGERCYHLEQGTSMRSHECKAISYNRYRVVYEKTSNAGDIRGVMADSFHMYNNETTYEGKEVTPETHLHKCTYSRKGFAFAGWATSRQNALNGIVAYADGEEIYNLTSENYVVSDEGDGEKGTIRLYAVWTPSSSTVKIGAVYNDGEEGTFNSADGYTTITKPYGSKYVPDESRLSVKNGYRVNFASSSNSGSGKVEVSSLTSKLIFKEWSYSAKLNGTYRDGTYYFTGSNGSVDVIDAVYTNGTIILPDAESDDPSKGFGGWAKDESGETVVGFPGDEYTPSKNETLYPVWVTLRLEAVNDYTSNNRKGAVDLTWWQHDTENKIYKVYQQLHGASEWKLLTDVSDDVSTVTDISKEFDYSGSSQVFSVPSTGYYEISAYGAQGGGYGSKSGGMGGLVKGKVWLKAGDIVTVTVGGSNGYNGGGSGSEGGNGGGATVVKSEMHGLLLVAGGGGGATINVDGGKGGLALKDGQMNSGNGESGKAGGGGGYKGGISGYAIVHHHNIDICGWHNHNEYCYGYVREIHTHTSSCYSTSNRYCGGKWWDSSLKKYVTGYCPNCGHERSGSCCDPSGNCAGGGTYLNCSKSYDDVYRLTCPLAESYMCGYEEGEIEKFVATCGGTSYVNDTCVSLLADEAGVNEGDGSVLIVSDLVGYSTAMKMDDVPANDLEAPDMIMEDGYTVEASGAGKVTVSWKGVEDNGTAYRHKVESYSTAGSNTGRLLCISNIPLNRLATGVCGYMYVLDEEESTQVDSLNKTGMVEVTTEQNEKSLINLLLSVKEVPQYLHLAAVDVAGNIAESCHILIPSIYDMIHWPIATGQIQISSEVGNKDYGSVYQKDEKTYYVKADGTTPFNLGFPTYMYGQPSLKYQCDIHIFDMSEVGGTKSETATTYLPYSSITEAGKVNLPVGSFRRMIDGSKLLKDAMNTSAYRENKASDTYFSQAFSVYSDMDGACIEIVPRVGATIDEIDTTWSDEVEDKTHNIFLIADGSGPEIMGDEVLSGLDKIEQGEEFIVDITAKDNLSGVKDIVVSISNKDNFLNKTFKADENGHVCIDLGAKSALTSGELAIAIKATDNVGNVTILNYGAFDLNLLAHLSNAKGVYQNSFHELETGLLNITTVGYVDRIEIEWPDVLTVGDWNRDIVTQVSYDGLQSYEQTEVLDFMVPLGTGTRSEYVTIKAYKGGVVLTRKLPLHLLAGLGGDVKVRIQ